ncbi:MAG: 2-amino-4-hydroxy-6-hydroxymethyldihydropteridine diphosphokinase [Phycisphaerae bacterium]|nr:2-amino-4-hydroxy-6-hydroxymethyldihydropteridine diphosphokinase [Phycisphaerae bacterium]
MGRVKAYIAMGSNVGERAQTLRKALDMMRQSGVITLRRVSTFIETKPVGGPDYQDDYLNAVVEIETALPPHELLASLNAIEATLGRDRSKEQRWGPRTCDLDILLYSNEMIDTPDLTIPHPRMTERMFVLKPLAEIAPMLQHPESFKTVAEMLAELEAAG